MDDVTAALAAIRGEGTFAVEQACPSDDLHIEVKGVGPVPFPISAAAAKKLCEAARPAPFGRRDKTLHDKRVRDTWEIAKSRIKIDARSWKRTLDAQLALLQARLGLPEEGALTATLDKMLLYEPGMFFAEHQDSERADDMVGSLVVELPSASSGAAVHVQLGAEEKVFRGAPRGPLDLSLLAFYADCRHEVKPVKSGFRIVLTYHLHYKGSVKVSAPLAPGVATDRLTEAVQAHFSTPVGRFATSTPERPDRLIYLLDHEYTEKSLDWDHLKNADRLRAEALCQVAERLSCEIFLTLADVHESWSCEEDEEEWDRRRGWSRDDFDEDEDDGDEEGSGDATSGEDYELYELLDEDVELRHWVSRDGKKPPRGTAIPAYNEVCATLSSCDTKPYKSEHEGYMGNYGNTVDRWYHRAAVVLWPRERNFVIRARVSPSWAVKQVASRLSAGAKKEVSAGAKKEARAMADSLLPFWSQAVRQDETDALFLDVLGVLSSLEDKDLALALLAPFGPQRFAPAGAAAFAQLVLRHGRPWVEKLFSTWRKHHRYQESSWLPLLPCLCEALVTGADKHGRGAAEWLLETETKSFLARQNGMLALPSVELEAERSKSLRDEAIPLLVAAAALDATATRDQIIALLSAPENRVSPASAAEMLQQCHGSRPRAAVKALGLGALYKHAVESLKTALAAPARSPDDWSIEPPKRCKCKLCGELSAFLRSPERIEHAWPLAEDGRAHVHQMIDGEQLPVTHVTSRRGRPYTLVLQKLPVLFEQAGAERARDEELLAWLKKHRSAF